MKWEWNEKWSGFHRGSDELRVYQVEKERKEEVLKKVCNMQRCEEIE